MRKGKSVIGKQILSLSTGQRLESVNDLVLDPDGRRMIALGLGGVALSFVGVNGREERQQVEGAIELHGEQWPAEWLRMRGLPEWAAYLEQKYTVGGEQ